MQTQINYQLYLQWRLLEAIELVKLLSRVAHQELIYYVQIMVKCIDKFKKHIHFYKHNKYKVASPHEA